METSATGAIGELLAELPGFTSQPVDLSSRLSTFESTDIGRLVLHRMGQVEGLTISATSAMAPKDAQKAYEKGREKAGKEKWDEAQQFLDQGGRDLSQVCGRLV